MDHGNYIISQNLILVFQNMADFEERDGKATRLLYFPMVAH